MFGNWINVHDLVSLVNAVRDGKMKKVAARLTGGRGKAVRRAWSHTESPPLNWWDIPAVQERWNRMISGDPGVDHFAHLADRYLAGHTGIKGLSLGCGTGRRELRWVGEADFARLDAYDLSPERIAFARDKAKEKGLAGMLNYEVGDILHLPARPGYYDVVFVEQALHHFSPLDRILRRVHDFLAPDGLFLVNEFVGPTRFQWTDRQLAATNELLARIPGKYRERSEGGRRKNRVYRRSKLDMVMTDPSEAIESARIMPLLRDTFDVVEVIPYGGAILHLLFNEIAFHFLSDEPEVKAILAECFAREDELMREGKLPSDFVIAVCRKRQRGVDAG